MRATMLMNIITVMIEPNAAPAGPRLVDAMIIPAADLRTQRRLR